MKDEHDNLRKKTAGIVYGRLFTSRDSKQLASIIRELWNNPEETDNYAKACLNLERDDLEAYCDKLVPIYLGGGNPL